MINTVKKQSSNTRLFLEVSGRLTTEIFDISTFPTKVGRSPDCDVVLNDQTVAPEQLIIDCDDQGEITITSLANKTDNPCKIGRKVIEHATQKGDKLCINIGRLTIKLSHGQDSIPKTIQLRPKGWLGALTSPMVACLLFAVVVFVSLYEAQLNSIEPFELVYGTYLELGLEVLGFLGYCVLVHLMRVRFSLVILSLSLILLCKVIELQSPLLIEQLEYAFNISTDDFLIKIVNLLLYFILWFVALKRQLHLTWKKANVHALLVCFPFFTQTIPGVMKQLSHSSQRVQTVTLNGNLEPYNWHIGETKTIDAYFVEANKALAQDAPVNP